jgi:hypothetical protein
MDGITEKDILLATAGASAALGGLVLVFLGVLIAAFQPLVGVASSKTLLRFKVAAVGALAVFGLSLASLATDVVWLVAHAGHCFYVSALVLFFVQLVGLAALAYGSTVHVLLKG